MRPRKPVEDLTGRTFTWLKVLERLPDHITKDNGHHDMWKCQCKCGKIVEVEGRHLLNGGTKSCGCYSTEILRKHSTTHGLSEDPLYKRWRNMIHRCYYENDINYHNYGGRGIYVCDEWYNPSLKGDELRATGNPYYIAFYNWAMESGYEPSLSIDRIDVDGPYSPDNCRWVTQKQQVANLRRNKYITVDGEKLTYAEYEQKYGLSESIVSSLTRNCGWSLAAIHYRTTHPEVGLKHKKGEYRDKDNFLVLIPTLDKQK
jgi:hypothetical protein